MLPFIYTAAFIEAHHGLAERTVSRNDLAHGLGNLLNFGIRHEIHTRTTVLHGMGLTDLAIQPARQRVIYHEDLFREHIMHYLLQDEAKRTYVGTATVRMVIADEPYIMRIYYLIVQSFQLIVDKCCQDGNPCFSAGRAQTVCKLLEGRTQCHPLIRMHVFAINPYIFHVFNSLNYISSTSFRNGPVTESGFRAICSGVPSATIIPPALPPSGPISKR